MQTNLKKLIKDLSDASYRQGVYDERNSVSDWRYICREIVRINKAIEEELSKYDIQ